MAKSDTTLAPKEREYLATEEVATVARALNVSRETARRLRDGLPSHRTTIQVARLYIAKQAGNAVK